MALSLTEHAESRAQQRGLTKQDMELIRSFGESIGDGYAMTNRAAQGHIDRLKQQIQRLRRLRGVVLIEEEDRVITVYRSTSKTLRKKLNRANGSSHT